MAYWVDDSFATWPETFRAGTAAAGLYVRCGAYCAANTTDGHIPLEVATSWGTREWIQKLVEVGLWEAEESGYRDVYYLVAPDGSKLNPTKVEVDANREKARIRQAKKRAKEKGNPNAVTRDNRVTHTSRTNGTHTGGSRAPSLPPSYEGKGERAPASQGAAHALPDDPSPSMLEDVENPDWRRGKAFGIQPDPAQAARTHSRMAEVRAQIRPSAKARERPGPVERARQSGASTDGLTAAVIELAAHRPPPDEGAA